MANVPRPLSPVINDVSNDYLLYFSGVNNSPSYSPSHVLGGMKVVANVPRPLSPVKTNIMFEMFYHMNCIYVLIERSLKGSGSF